MINSRETTVCIKTAKYFQSKYALSDNFRATSTNFFVLKTGLPRGLGRRRGREGGGRDMRNVGFTINSAIRTASANTVLNTVQP